MNKTDKLITLPQARELSELCKEKGIVLPESEYVYAPDEELEGGKCTYEIRKRGTVERSELFYCFPAFCCAELGVILMSKYAIILNKLEEFHCILEPEGNFGGGRTETGKTMAESMCAMLIYLISNGYLTK